MHTEKITGIINHSYKLFSVATSVLGVAIYIESIKIIKVQPFSQKIHLKRAVLLSLIIIHVHHIRFNCNKPFPLCSVASFHPNVNTKCLQHDFDCTINQWIYLNRKQSWWFYIYTLHADIKMTRTTIHSQ